MTVRTKDGIIGENNLACMSSRYVLSYLMGLRNKDGVLVQERILRISIFITPLAVTSPAKLQFWVSGMFISSGILKKNLMLILKKDTSEQFPMMVVSRLLSIQVSVTIKTENLLISRIFRRCLIVVHLTQMEALISISRIHPFQSHVLRLTDLLSMDLVS